MVKNDKRCNSTYDRSDLRCGDVRVSEDKMTEPTNGNGHSELKANEMGTNQLLEVLVEAMQQLNENFEDFKVEVLEKLENLNLDNDGFGLLDED